MSIQVSEAGVYETATSMFVSDAGTWIEIPLEGGGGGTTGPAIEYLLLDDTNVRIRLTTDGVPAVGIPVHLEYRNPFGSPPALTLDRPTDANGEIQFAMNYFMGITFFTNDPWWAGTYTFVMPSFGATENLTFTRDGMATLVSNTAPPMWSWIADGSGFVDLIYTDHGEIRPGYSNYNGASFYAAANAVPSPGAALTLTAGWTHSGAVAEPFVARFDVAPVGRVAGTHHFFIGYFTVGATALAADLSRRPLVEGQETVTWSSAVANDPATWASNEGMFVKIPGTAWPGGDGTFSGSPHFVNAIPSVGYLDLVATSPITPQVAP